MITCYRVVPEAFKCYQQYSVKVFVVQFAWFYSIIGVDQGLCNSVALVLPERVFGWIISCVTSLIVKNSTYYKDGALNQRFVKNKGEMPFHIIKFYTFKVSNVKFHI
jgi:hypothetical protein